MKSVLPVVVLCAAAISGLAGCVRPWERGTLQKIQERFDRPASMRSWEGHVFMVREGAAGGQGKAGGGCGCN